LPGSAVKYVLPHARKAYEGLEAQIHSFLTSALHGGGWSASRPGRFSLANNPRHSSNRRMDGCWNIRR